MMPWLPLDHTRNYSLWFNYSFPCTQFMLKTNNLPERPKTAKVDTGESGASNSSSNIERFSGSQKAHFSL